MATVGVPRRYTLDLSNVLPGVLPGAVNSHIVTEAAVTSQGCELVGSHHPVEFQALATIPGQAPLAPALVFQTGNVAVAQQDVVHRAGRGADVAGAGGVRAHEVA